jgi:hypothetical protein
MTPFWRSGRGFPQPGIQKDALGNFSPVIKNQFAHAISVGIGVKALRKREYQADADQK